MQLNCDFNSELVISGLSGRFPKSSNLEEFWQNLIDGVDMVGDAQDRYNMRDYDVPSRMALMKDLGKFDAEFFTLHGKQADTLDPRTRMLLEVTYEAVLDAGLNPSEIKGSNTGVFVGACDSAAFGIATRSATGENINPYTIFGNATSMISNRLSYFFNLNGPSSVVDTACSSSFFALQQALLSIRTGLCNSAIVASATTHHDAISSHCFHKLKMTSPDGKSKCFDASADGYVRAEAAVAIYICKKQVAKRSYCTVVHAVTNCDGYKEEGITFPSEIYQERAIRQVYKEAGVNPLEVGYIEAHGTGTKVGDPQEMKAVTNVFCDGRETPLLIGSIKSNMGHPEGTSGLCAIAKIILSNATGVIPANLHYNNPSPDIPGLHDGRLKVVDKNQSFIVNYVGINSMGFGGSNVHVLVKLDPKQQPEPYWSPTVPVIIICSGRTQEAVEIFLEKTLSRRQNHSFVRLTHEIYRSDISKHGFRGFVVVGKDKMEISIDKRGYSRELWYIVTGLGSQWEGMSRDLIKFDVFKTSIETVAKVLLNKHFNLLSLLNCGDSKLFEDFKNSVVCITAVQVALIDLLRSIGIKPDGIVGHSTGEVAAGYADGCITQEQTALISFARVHAMLESNLPPGTVASVGLTWEVAKQQCPPGIWPAIHNGEENVTIAGSPDNIQAFTKQLADEGIFVKLVRSACFGFHSPLVAESGKLMKTLLEEIITQPKLRSNKWLSSSVPYTQWNSELTKYCSADYHINNMVNPVYFYPTLKHVPNNIVALEIGPHCFMQSILKKSLSKDAVVLGLIHVKSPDNCIYFLNSVGKCYVAGMNVDVAMLYETIQFPVSATTPSISSMIRWDHSETYNVPHESQEVFNHRGTKFTFNLQTEKYSFLNGHSLDGKNLFPATGYIWMAWNCFARQSGDNFENIPVVLENIRFERATFLSKRNATNLVINIFNASGKFEVSEADNLVCSGNVRNPKESCKLEMLNYDRCENIGITRQYLNNADFYKELQLRGYGYSGLFQGVVKAHPGGDWSKVKWQGEWISFLDTIMQTFILQNEKRDLYVPLRIQKLTIDPIQVTNTLEGNDSIILVKSWKNHSSVTCPGLEFRGLKIAKLNQKSRHLPPTVVEQRFLPYINEFTQSLQEIAALEASLQIAVDNCYGGKFVFTEILKDPANMIGHILINETILKFPVVENRLVNESDMEIDREKLSDALSKVTSIPDVKSGDLSNVVFLDDVANLVEAVNLISQGGFILIRATNLDLDHVPDVIIVSEKRFWGSTFYLLKKIKPAPVNAQVINIDTAGYSWVALAKSVLTITEKLDRVLFVSTCPTSGINGFIKCLTREITSGKVRSFHAVDSLEFNFKVPSKRLDDQLKKDMLINIYKDKTWGTLCNMSIPIAEFKKKKPSSIAYANALTLGDLSSLTWIESPLKNETKELIKVSYSALNFKDIMLASGKLSQDVLTENEVEGECILGLEFSGTYQGNRVCGTGNSDCLATHVDPEKMILLNVPDNWTLEEAATVPCVYSTVYLALVIQGRMQPGESILIHAGSGGVGQAAIQIALGMNCKIFTTVSTNEKREFLKERFPSLTDDCITNSRNARDFESHINEYTRGRGVDLVLNCLADDKLYATIRCLAVNGRFLEIGKFDILNDTTLGMYIFAKGIKFLPIFADAAEKRKTTSISKMTEWLQHAMKSDAIRSLTYHVFKHDELETAFRFMAQGKHIGKVLIQVKGEQTSLPVVEAIPRTHLFAYKSYIIIGGLGGMGFELANWLVQRGATKIVLSSRSGKLSSYHEYHMDMWIGRGFEILLDNSDVSTFEGAKRLLENAKRLAPVGGIFNSAVVLMDAIFNNQTQEDFEIVGKCKAHATGHLDALTRQLTPDLDYFVVFSSIVAARGNPGQTNYGFANSVMERICEQRKLDGLPALAVQWGAVGDVGVFHRTMQDKRVLLGLAPQSLKSCLETLDLYLQQDRTTVSSFIPFYKKQASTVNSSDSLESIVANVLGIKDVKKVNAKMPLVELGMDSLMTAELVQVLQARANLQFSPKECSLLTFEKLKKIDGKGNSAGSMHEPLKFLDLYKSIYLNKGQTKAVVRMNSLGTCKDNVFIVHPIDGTMQMLEELVRNLDANIYGIECVMEAPIESIEKLAEYYLNEIKNVQPTGPYKIAGYSFGASVAFELALQLEKQNEKVSLLLLLDGSPRLNQTLTLIYTQDDLSNEKQNTIILKFISQYMSIPFNVYTSMSKCPSQKEKLNYAVTVVHESSPHVSIDDIYVVISGYLRRIESAIIYEPSSKVKSKAVLVKCTKSSISEDIAWDYGLSEICEEAVDIIEVDGSHNCFFENPLETGLPKILNKILE